MVERLLPAPLMFRSPHGMDAGKVSMLLPCVRAPAASRRQRLEKNATAPTTVQGGRQRQRVRSHSLHPPRNVASEANRRGWGR